MELGDIKNVIERNPVALATTDEGNNPYAIAVAYVKVREDNIIITDNYMKTTIKNIKANPNVCLVVWDNNWNGYQIKGKAEYFDKGKWLEFVKTISENKDEPSKGAILIGVENIKQLS
ncbi:MAG: pyridoxamine 5'-phosphate oxidase family protein [Candidatus Nanoarchaeia archaeon]